MNHKDRLTITLPKNLLKQVDSIIDKQNIRNRSHAIEHLIRKSLIPSVSSAIILAGGNTKNPIPLKKVHQLPLLSIIIDHLKKFSVYKLIVCAGKHNQAIQKEFGDGSKQGVKLIYVNESKNLGTAGAIKNAQKHLKHETFLVLHGDILTNLNINDFITFHQNEQTLATIAVKPRMSETNYGQAMLQGNKIIKFSSQGSKQGISIINTGVYIFKPQIFNFIAQRKAHSLEQDVFPKLARENNLSAFIFQGIWFDISNPKNHQLASARWKNK